MIVKPDSFGTTRWFPEEEGCAELRDEVDARERERGSRTALARIKACISASSACCASTIACKATTSSDRLGGSSVEAFTMPEELPVRPRRIKQNQRDQLIISGCKVRAGRRQSMPSVSI